MHGQGGVGQRVWRCAGWRIGWRWRGSQESEEGTKWGAQYGACNIQPVQTRVKTTDVWSLPYHYYYFYKVGIYSKDFRHIV